MLQKPIKGFLLVVIFLAVLFSRPLYHLALFAAGSDLYSYVLLIPGIAFYLGWLRRRELIGDTHERGADLPVADRLCAAGFLLSGTLTITFYWAFGGGGSSLSKDDSLAMSTFSFVCLLIGLGVWFFGIGLMRKIAFPAFFLFFVVPFPTFFVHWFEGFLQRASADAASVLFAVSDSTVYRDGLVFKLPGLTLEVARECSGIHSTLVLFITALIAGYLFLRSWWKRALLASVVVPLGILRNGFRIFTLGYMTVHVNPDIIDSPLHHRGGPIFFVLSLVPFGALLLWLRRSERRTKNGSGLGASEAVNTRATGAQRA